MSDCCCGNSKNKLGICPVHGGEGKEVALRTVLHHMKTPWRSALSSQHYYFCEDEACPVVYFGEDGSCFEQDALRERVGQKGCSATDMLCYCFDIRYGDAAKKPSLKAYVVEQTRAGLCSCDTRNPSGRCCLKDFP